MERSLVPLPPWRKHAESQETDGRTGSPCLDNAEPTRGNLGSGQKNNGQTGSLCLAKTVLVYAR